MAQPRQQTPPIVLAGANGSFYAVDDHPHRRQTGIVDAGCDQAQRQNQEGNAGDKDP